jgi:hypothetical protein
MVMIQEQVKRRFEDLSKQAQQIPLQGNQEIGRYAAPQAGIQCSKCHPGRIWERFSLLCTP